MEKAICARSQKISLIPKRENISIIGVLARMICIYVYIYTQTPTSKHNDNKVIAKNHKKLRFEIVIILAVSRMLFKEARFTY